MDRRFDQEAPVAEADRLRIVTYTLLGLRYPPDLADVLMPGIRSMRDSSTYQAILDEGRAEGRADEARSLLVHLGTRRFGPPDASVRATLDAIQAPERLDEWCRHLLDVSSWDELLATS